MKFFRNAKDIFDGVPGPTPWYLRASPPALSGLEWRDAGQKSPFAGKTLLVNKQGLVAIFDFHNYISLFNQSLLLIWHQHPAGKEPTAPVHMRVIDPTQLRPLSGELEDLCHLMKNEGVSLLYDGCPIVEIDLATTTVGKPINTVFPPPLSEINELLILCHSSGVDPEPGWERSNLALLVAHPSRSTYQLYPQDWFNGAGLDYGYQWVTRVVRNPATQQIHGEGIRIAPFVLDNTLRQKVNDGAL